MQIFQPVKELPHQLWFWIVFVLPVQVLNHDSDSNNFESI